MVEHSEDDDYIQELIESAEDNLRHLINQPLEDVLIDGRLPPSLMHAIKILVGKFYAFREGDKVGKAEDVSFTLANLFMPYRKET